MRMSRMFGKTLRNDPAEAELVSHRLMLRTGMIYQVSAGVYSYMPLALRSLKRSSRSSVRRWTRRAGRKS